MSEFNGLPPEQALEGVIRKPGIHFGWGTFITALSAIYMLYCVIYVLDLIPMIFGKSLSGSQHIGIFLGIILFLAFLLTPLKTGARKNSIPWYDVVLAVLSLIPPLYYAIFYETLLFALEFTTPINATLGWMLIILTWEASRRSMGWPFAIIIALAVVYLIFGENFPGSFKSDSFALEKIGRFMFVARDGIIGIPVDIASKTILTFLLFAEVLFLSGAGEWFVNIANSLVGHVRGGPAKAAVIGSGLLGMVTASPPANVASVGTITIPLMKKMGFKSTFAAGVEAVASTGGQIMPPVMGSVVFVLCNYIGMPYGQLIIYAFIPAILYYFALFITVDMEAAKLKIKGIPRSELPSFTKTIKDGYWYIIPMVVLLVCMIVLTLSPEKSAIYAFLTIIFISLFRKQGRMGFKKLVTGAEGALKALMPVAVACAGCGIIIGALTLSLVSYKLTFQLTELIGQNLFIVLAMAALISYIMGMGVGPLVSYLTLAMMVAPAVEQMGVPTLAAHLFLFYWAITCFITPPYAIASFVAAGIAKCSLWGAGFKAMHLGIGTYLVPFIFVYHPALLLIGSPLEIVQAIGFAIIGITALMAGLEGYLLSNLNVVQRVLLAVGGIAFSLSDGTVLIISAIAIAIAVVWHIISVKTAKPVVARL